MKLIVKDFTELTVSELYSILKLRNEVFIVEQKIIYQDLDDVDKIAKHVYMLENEEVVGYARIYAYAGEENTYKMGRIVSKTRGEGIGSKIVCESIKVVEKTLGGEKIIIDAQTHAQKFYEKQGFVVCSDEFLEEGIFHKKMIYKL